MYWKDLVVVATTTATTSAIVHPKREGEIKKTYSKIWGTGSTSMSLETRRTRVLGPVSALEHLRSICCRK